MKIFLLAALIAAFALPAEAQYTPESSADNVPMLSATPVGVTAAQRLAAVLPGTGRGVVTIGDVATFVLGGIGTEAEFEAALFTLPDEFKSEDLEGDYGAFVIGVGGTSATLSADVVQRDAPGVMEGAIRHEPRTRVASGASVDIVAAESNKHLISIPVSVQPGSSFALNFVTNPGDYVSLEIVVVQTNGGVGIVYPSGISAPEPLNAFAGGSTSLQPADGAGEVSKIYVTVNDGEVFVDGVVRYEEDPN